MNEMELEFKIEEPKKLKEISKDWFSKMLDQSLYLYPQDIFPNLPNNEGEVKNRLAFGVYYQKQLVGIFLGKEEAPYQFHMGISIVHPDFQGRGIYKKILSYVTDWCQQKGYMLITSNHHMCNNRIISLKLKNGFYIHTFEQKVVGGSYIKLIKYLDKNLEDLFLFRTSYKAPTQWVSAKLKLAINS